jgi:glycosyltransferase involved in cell wall biosynthesis
VNLTVLMNAGPWLSVPPEGYGGIETVVASLVPELRRAGVRIVLATVGTSTLEADAYIRPIAEPRFRSVAAPYNQVSGIAHAYMCGVVEGLRGDPTIDLVHDHLEVVGPAVLMAAGEQSPPVLQTLHWDLRKHADFYSSFDGHGRVAFAAVSHPQLDAAPASLRAQTIGVVPLAVPVPENVAVERGCHAVVLARITRDKGQDIAARVCLRAGVPLVLAGPVAGIDDPVELDRRLAAGDAALEAHPDVRFYLNQVAPLIDGKIVRWIGGVAGLHKERLLRSAVALLTPIRWAEPGGTAVVEALARGIPVVGTPMGVLSSLVDHGVTGYLGRDEDALTHFLRQVGKIDPADCRAAVATWTPKEMARRYLELYDILIRNTQR